MDGHIMVKQMVISIFNAIRSRKKLIPPLPEKIWQDPLYFIAFGLGSGAMPVAPGTFGTLMAIPFYLLLQPLPLLWYITIVILFIIASSWISDHVVKKFIFMKIGRAH